ncbi:MAG TPA: hypothetical protein VFV80_01120 [Geminicoccaceae bacterium]|nr:hypothetical protein [Geminicoccaceae bacterium]
MPATTYGPPRRRPRGSSDAERRGALLRALLAGAVALLVLLLPGQLAASRDRTGSPPEAWALDAGAVRGAGDERSKSDRLDVIRPVGNRHGVG